MRETYREKEREREMPWVYFLSASAAGNLARRICLDKSNSII
jgi:hypothetical protein